MVADSPRGEEQVVIWFLTTGLLIGGLARVVRPGSGTSV